EADFWGELETNLEQILNSNAGLGYLRTQNDPTITVAEANPQAPVVAVDGIDEVELGEDAGPVPTPGQDQAQPPVVQAPNTVLQVQTLPQTTETNSGTENPNEVSFTPAFSINRQAGLISVYANKRIHEQVNEYLMEVRKNATAQVLIEAKVLEVNLSDEFSAGINWNLLDSFFDSDLSIGFAGGTTGGLGLTPTATNALTLTYSGDNITSIVDAIARFGTVHALASPRLTVLNNQPAVLNVAQNIVYFTLDIERTDGTDDNPPTTTIDSEVNSVPEGVLINVIPSVNPDTQTITLQIRPTVTRVVDRAFDPATSVTLADSGLPTTLDEGIPELNVQEIDSILNMKSGQIAILGGLLQDRSDNTSESVPVLGEVPIVGNLFKARTSSISKTELVIFIKATIIDAPGSIHNTDKELYRTFAQDRRPLRF
ncbi:MAG: type II and III secretion system family protein, partial [Alphaproteobacteria bacterium]|nr:type II and III secretion system family protein [Alphaproteobacteria bacterium]